MFCIVISSLVDVERLEVASLDVDVVVGVTAEVVVSELDAVDWINDEVERVEEADDVSVAIVLEIEVEELRVGFSAT